MNDEKFKEIERQEYNYLDSINIDRVMVDNDALTVSELMSYLENEYESDYLEKHPDDSCLFNCINSYEFSNYLRKRYGWFMREISDYTIYC